MQVIEEAGVEIRLGELCNGDVFRFQKINYLVTNIISACTVLCVSLYSGDCKFLSLDTFVEKSVASSYNVIY